MYKRTETQAVAELSNGAEIYPVATLRSEAGGVAHIWVDDGCYELGLERHVLIVGKNPTKTIVVPVTHIFTEAFDVLKTLPTPSKKLGYQIASGVVTDIDTADMPVEKADAPDFRSELSSLLNKHSMENGSDTPDFILRNFLCDCLKSFDSAVTRRGTFYGHGDAAVELSGDHIVIKGDVSIKSSEEKVKP